MKDLFDIAETQIQIELNKEDFSLLKKDSDHRTKYATDKLITVLLYFKDLNKLSLLVYKAPIKELHHKKQKDVLIIAGMLGNSYNKHKKSHEYKEDVISICQQYFMDAGFGHRYKNRAKNGLKEALDRVFVLRIKGNNLNKQSNGYIISPEAIKLSESFTYTHVLKADIDSYLNELLKNPDATIKVNEQLKYVSCPYPKLNPKTKIKTEPYHKSKMNISMKNINRTIRAVQDYSVSDTVKRQNLNILNQLKSLVLQYGKHSPIVFEYTKQSFGRLSGMLNTFPKKFRKILFKGMVELDIDASAPTLIYLLESVIISDNRSLLGRTKMKALRTYIENKETIRIKNDILFGYTGITKYVINYLTMGQPLSKLSFSDDAKDFFYSLGADFGIFKEIRKNKFFRRFEQDIKTAKGHIKKYLLTEEENETLRDAQITPYAFQKFESVIMLALSKHLNANNVDHYVLYDACYINPKSLKKSTLGADYSEGIDAFFDDYTYNWDLNNDDRNDLLKTLCTDVIRKSASSYIKDNFKNSSNYKLLNLGAETVTNETRIKNNNDLSEYNKKPTKELAKEAKEFDIDEKHFRTRSIKTEERYERIKLKQSQLKGVNVFNYDDFCKYLIYIDPILGEVLNLWNTSDVYDFNSILKDLLDNEIYKHDIMRYSNMEDMSDRSKYDFSYFSTNPFIRDSIKHIKVESVFKKSHFKDSVLSTDTTDFDFDFLDSDINKDLFFKFLEKVQITELAPQEFIINISLAILFGIFIKLEVIKSNFYRRLTEKIKIPQRFLLYYALSENSGNSL